MSSPPLQAPAKPIATTALEPDLRDRSGLPWLKSCLTRAAGSSLDMLVLSLGLQMLALVSPLAYQVIIDRVLAHAGYSTLGVVLVGLVAVAGVERVLGSWRGRRQRQLAADLDAELRAGLGWRTAQLPPALLRRWAPEDHQARLRDLDLLRQALLGPLATAPAEALAAVLLWLVLAAVAPVLAAVTALACLAQVALLAVAGRGGARPGQPLESRSSLADALADLDGLPTRAAADALLERQGRALAQARAEQFVAVAQQAERGETQTFIQRLQGVLVLGLAAQAVMQGQLSVGGMVASNLLVGRINAVWQRLLAAAAAWRELRPAWQGLSRWADFPLDPLPGAGSPVRAIEIRDLVCPPLHPARPPVRLAAATLVPGDWVVLTGASGVGKTLLGRVLAGLDRPWSGQIELHTEAAGAVAAPDLRSVAVWVGPEVRIWNADLEANLSVFGGLQVAEHRRAALETALELPAWRAAHRALLQTPLGRGGWCLSSGERARVQLFRAWASGAALLVIDGLDLALQAREERRLWARLQGLPACAGPPPAVILITARPERVPGVTQHWSIEAGRVSVRSLAMPVAESRAGL